MAGAAGAGAGGKALRMLAPPSTFRAKPWVAIGQYSSPLLYAYSMNTSTLNFKELPVSERIQLVEDIWDSIAEETSGSLELSSEERAELQRRYAAHQADPSSSIPWDQVRATLFKNRG